MGICNNMESCFSGALGTLTPLNLSLLLRFPSIELKVTHTISLKEREREKEERTTKQRRYSWSSSHLVPCHDF